MMGKKKPRVKILGQTVIKGSKKHKELMWQKKHFDDLRRWSN